VIFPLPIDLIGPLMQSVNGNRVDGAGSAPPAAIAADATAAGSRPARHRAAVAPK
jgi:hypothetical protein